MVEITECHICHSDNIKILSKYGDKFDGEIVRMCLTCGLAFLSPRMSEAELNNYYSSDLYNIDFRKSATVTEAANNRLEKLADIMWNAIKEFFFDINTFLEIGCAAGSFLSRVTELVPSTYGVDPSEEYVNSNQSLIKSGDTELRVGTFPDESFEDLIYKFDAIGIFHTLEHVEDPRKVLQTINARLNDNGLLFIEYPDLAMAATGRPTLAHNYFQRSHLYDFSGFNLINLLAETGFGIIHGAITNPEYPTDKNVLLVCKKTNDKIEQYVDSDMAQKLYFDVKKKLPAPDELRLNFGARIRVIHVASHNINVGDGAISSGIRRVFSSLIGDAVDYFAMDIVDYLGNLSTDTINDHRPDLVIIGGGGTIDGHESRVQTGTALMLSQEELLKIHAPITFVGLGHNLFPNQTFAHQDILNDFILFLKSEGMPFSVRRDGSRRRLGEILTPEALSHIQEIPDPGFFVGFGSDIRKNANRHFSPLSQRRIVLQIAGDSTTSRIGNSYENFCGQISVLLNKLALMDSSTYVMLATHTFDDLFAQTFISVSEYVHDIIRRVKISSTGLCHPIYAEDFFGSYAVANLVVGMRGHSIVCGTGLGIPTVAISTHDKVSGYMDEVGASKWSISPSDNLADEVYDLSVELLNNPQEQLDIVRRNTAGWLNEFKRFLFESARKM